MGCISNLSLHQVTRQQSLHSSTKHRKTIMHRSTNLCFKHRSSTVRRTLFLSPTSIDRAFYGRKKDLLTGYRRSKAIETTDFIFDIKCKLTTRIIFINVLTARRFFFFFLHDKQWRLSSERTVVSKIESETTIRRCVCVWCMCIYIDRHIHIYIRALPPVFNPTKSRFRLVESRFRHAEKKKAAEARCYDEGEEGENILGKYHEERYLDTRRDAWLRA